MFTRRSVITLLVGLNILLAAILTLGAYSLPRALAQSGGGAGDFICVTAKAAGFASDVLYVLDLPERKLHGFYPKNVQTKQLEYAGFRDLQADFK